jgi:hypothetical protein
MRGKNFKAEQIDDNSVDIAFRAMTGWVWEKDDDGEQAEFNGKVPDFNAANVKAVLTTLPWFRDQITAKISEEKDFFQG